MMEPVERGDALPSRLPLSRLSFRWQITLLGTLVFVLFVAVLFATFATLRYTKSAVLGNEKKQVVQSAQSLAREYEDKADFSHKNNELPPLSNPGAATSREVLALLSRVVLQNTDGVTGGFYSKAGDKLLGYSSPDHDFAQESQELELAFPDEHQVILDVARGAAASNQPSERILSSGQNIVLIESVPIRDASTVVGSAWSVKRLIGLPGSNRFRAYLTTAGLGTAALASVLLTLLVIGNLQGGVRKIERGLEGLERNLESKIDTQYDPEEIQRIVQAINRLGTTLKQKIEREKQIESELRHSERLASLGRLVAGVAHEVRNPLATIRLRLQMCRREAANSRVHESCSIALEEVERLNGMVNRLLNFSRPVQLHLEPTDLRDLVEERTESFREQASKSRVRIVTNLPEEEKALAVDKGHMAQVFDNIIQNAIEAMADGGGTLSVSVASIEMAERPAGVRVEFRDTGKGMTPAIVSHIFDPFFTTKPSGTGLGLSICHEFVTAHGGEIHVESEEGRGTSVRIIMPAALQAASA
jgi:signal transduction histidine kinase